MVFRNICFRNGSLQDLLILESSLKEKLKSLGNIGELTILGGHDYPWNIPRIVREPLFERIKQVAEERYCHLGADEHRMPTVPMIVDLYIVSFKHENMGTDSTGSIRIYASGDVYYTQERYPHTQGGDIK